ncbi:MAG: hypothetical protein ACK6D7_14115, partial [Acidobacteriota bacterium]
TRFCRRARGGWCGWRCGTLKERTLAFRLESNNLTNSPQFAEPGTALTDPNFGMITNTLNDGRSFRFSLRFSY